MSGRENGEVDYVELNVRLNSMQMAVGTALHDRFIEIEKEVQSRITQEILMFDWTEVVTKMVNEEMTKTLRRYSVVSIEAYLRKKTDEITTRVINELTSTAKQLQDSG